MVDYNYKDLFTKSHVDKQLRIATDDRLFTATNQDIHFEDFELTESLCSETELRFGNCEPSMVKFQIRNAFIPLIGKWLTITETLDGNTDVPFQYGRYKVFSDKPTADKEYRDVVAYDAMYDILNADVSEWYNTILPSKNSTVTLKQFRGSFIRYFRLTEVVPTEGLANDDMIVKRTIEPEQLSGKDVIESICEINGCFGHIGRDGKFHYIYLPQNIQGLYPSNDLYPDHAPDYLPQQQETRHLYPQDPKGERLGAGRYIKCQYEDYVVRQINKLQIRQEENDVGCIYETGDNCYIIENNFLVYGKGTSELNPIAQNLYEKINGIVYRPFSVECVGNPCLEVGDPIRLRTKYHIVESYILERKINRIQALRDIYSSRGSEKRSEKVNGIQKSIVQLKGKSNVLERTIEETKSELKNTEKNLISTISQTASEIRSEVAEADSGLSTRISQNKNSITAEVKRATGSEGDLSARITVNEKGISQRVVKGNVSSEISQEAGAIDIRANRLTISSDNFSLSADGRVSAINANVSGNISASSGTFDNVTIRESCTVAGQSISGTIGGGHIGYGINASNLSTGIIGRPYSLNGFEVNETGATLSTDKGYTTLNAQRIYAQIPMQVGGSYIGTQNTPFVSAYINTIFGTVSSGSSRKIKTNIKKYDTQKCIGIINRTEIMSYNYKNDIKNNKEAIESVENEKAKYINAIRIMDDSEKPSEEEYQKRIFGFDENIKNLKNERETFPETRYGFISEEAPWELVSMDRKTVDTYSAVAMCFGAIQELSKKIEELENIIKNGRNCDE